MSWWASLFGGGVTEPIKAVGDIIDDLYTSEGEVLDKKEALARLAQKSQDAAAKLQAVESQHRSIWVAGWRPGIGWACGAILFIVFGFGPMAFWILNIWQALSNGTPIPPPSYPPMDQFWTVLLALLGLGGMRTVEKLTGRAR